jgi:hypothetical protein
LVALRKAFPGFTPTSGWWSAVERELKNCHHRSNPAGHDAFCAAYPYWTATDLIQHLEAEGRIKPPRLPRGESVCERLRALHKDDPNFAETEPERAIAQRIGKKSAGSLAKSHYWIHTLKPKRLEVRARAQLARSGIKSNAAFASKAQARMDNWTQRDEVDRWVGKIDADKAAAGNPDSAIDGGH